MSGMFSYCSNLKTIFVSPNWNCDFVEVFKSNSKFDAMFYGCNNLMGGKGTEYDESKIDKTFARIDRGIHQPGYFTEK
jgi:hypothetical protein